jgi:poly [ADP-ribose] polymerase 2/3/4
MSVIRQVMLVKADDDVNSNKFWEAIVHDNGTVDCRWGRVGADGQRKSFGGGESYVEKKMREKIKEGYREAKVVTGIEAAKTTTVASSALESLAKKQIAHTDTEVEKLIGYLVKVNAHQITTQSGGKLNVNLSTGQVTTPLGIVTKEAITEAREKLEKIEESNSKKSRSNKASKRVVEDYLMLIPQDIGRGRGWADSLWSTDDDIKRQYDLLDSLEATIGAISTTPAPKTDETVEKVFDVKLSLIKDPAILARINKFYQSTRQSMHASHHLNIKRVFSVEMAAQKAAFEAYGAKLSNIMELWHGTKAANLLSILKSGLIIPKSHGSIAVTGRAFGDGVYFSDQSTKSLNYAYGYWNSSGGYDNNCFMFLANVAMGNYYVPAHTFGGTCPAGYNSTWAKAGKSGVVNNEMIVYRLDQLNLTYLVEFGQ